MTILNFRPIDDHIASSGQPSAAQFQLIADAGFDTVINLALTSSNNAIVHEDDAVLAAGLRYVHLPVSWTAPRLADVLDFFTLMQALAGRRVWVHCALNKRVSCFLYLYRRYRLGLPDADARTVMDSLWRPEGVWARLILNVDHHFSAQGASRDD